MHESVKLRVWSRRRREAEVGEEMGRPGLCFPGLSLPDLVTRGRTGEVSWGPSTSLSSL